jgi:hypothetical protein
MFLAHAACLKVRVRQLDFVGAFLQAKMRTRMFVTIPKIYGILFPEYAEYCGKPVRLQMLMYGTMLCGKYWYLDLLAFLKEIDFQNCLCSITSMTCYTMELTHLRLTSSKNSWEMVYNWQTSALNWNNTDTADPSLKNISNQQAVPETPENMTLH